MNMISLILLTDLKNNILYGKEKLESKLIKKYKEFQKIQNEIQAIENKIDKIEKDLKSIENDIKENR